MSTSSRTKKIRPKGTVRQLKVVNTISRSESDILKLEEVKTPRKKATSNSQRNMSSSPIKHPNLEGFHTDSFSSYMEGLEIGKKRETLVFLFL